jgi:beta-galactosidase
LWSPETPDLYEVRTVLKENAVILDQYHTPLGIRKIEFSPEWGFRLNGEPMIFKGTCNHDASDGIVGSAVPDDVLYWRLKRLKDMGSNAIRTSHNPRSPEFYTFCDVLGLMVMDEAFDGWDTPKAAYDYGLYFGKWWKKDLDSFVRRDRNHPSVIMWSIGNEVKKYSDARQKELVDFVHSLDNTRPVTQGRGYMGPYIDIAGFNGHGEEKYMLENYHMENTGRPMIGTEMTHTLQTRGVYRTQSKYRVRDFPAHWEARLNWEKYKEKVYLVPNLSDREVFTGIPKVYKSSYDNCIVHIDVRDQFKHDSRYPYLMGSFRWSGFDYLGKEYSDLPLRAVDKGVIDLAGIVKDHYYLYQSLWTRAPMVHMLPHWTHPGKEGVKIPVVVYSNCRRIELFFNDVSLGEQEMGDELQLVWQVPYRPGRLLAIGRDSGGIKLAETVQQTAGSPFAIRIEGDKVSMRANRRDVLRLDMSVVDEHGVVVPDADNIIGLKITGPARLLGLDNGDVADLTKVKTERRRVFKGRCAALIQSTDRGGEVKINVISEGLKTGEYRLQII